MISRVDFASIDNEIKNTIYDTLNDLRNSNQNNYALFLADGEYSKDLEKNVHNLNPNVIDNRMDRYKDS